MFSPLAFPSGLVIYDLSTSEPLPSHLALAPFEIFRQPLVIVGIIDGEDLNYSLGSGSAMKNGLPVMKTRDNKLSDGCYEQLAEGLDQLRERYTNALVHQILVFDHKTSATPLPEGVAAVPSPQDSRTTTIKTVMCDLTSLLLAEMTSYAKSLQALSTIDSPKAALDDRMLNGSPSGSAATIDGYSRQIVRTSASIGARPLSPHNASANGQYRMSMPAHLPSTETQLSSRSASPTSGARTPPATFENSSRANSARVQSSDYNGKRQISRDRIPVQGFGPGSIGERQRNRGKGRVGVVIGSLYLLAGRWPDAIKELVESASVVKAHSDHLWHAKALDYILVCLLMLGWAGMDFQVNTSQALTYAPLQVGLVSAKKVQIPHICYPIADKSNPTPTKLSNHAHTGSMPDLTFFGPPNAANCLASLQSLTNLLPDLVNNILNLYNRANTFTEDRLPHLAFSETTIRLAKLLTVIRLAHGQLEDDGLQQLVLNSRHSQGLSAASEQPNTFPSKAEITAFLFRGFPSPSETLLPVVERTIILAGIAAVLSELGYQRKKALVLKELITALLPSLVQARKEGAAAMGVHPAASLAALNAISSVDGSEISRKQQPEADHGILGFLTLLCSTYGVVVSEPFQLDGTQPLPHGNDGKEYPPISTGNSDSNDAVTARIAQNAATRSGGSQYLKLNVLHSCISLCEALPDLDGVLRFSSDLLRTAGSGIAPDSDSSEGAPTIPAEDQLRLANNLSRTFNTARQLGYKDLTAEYWDEFLVRGVEVEQPARFKRPTLHAKAELEAAETSMIGNKSSPFIYNPFLKKPTSTAIEPLLVVGEEAVFGVTLQNLYDFNVEVEELRLECTGVPMDFEAQSMVIGPYRTQKLMLPGIPKAPGSMKIGGCIVKIKGCRQRRFPIFSEPWKVKKPLRIKSAAGTPTGSTSAKVTLPQHVQSPQASTLTFNVIGPQPDVVIKSTSLPQAALMLLEGEMQTFTVTLLNRSGTIPVDLLLLSFTDSAMAKVQSVMNNKDLSATELYELELSSMQKPAFRWRRADLDQDLSIPPGQEVTLEIEALGKPGLSSSTVQVDYGHLGVPKSDITTRFYTRQVSWQVTVTVNASADLVRNDLLPFTGDFAWSNQVRQKLPEGSIEGAAHHRRRRTSSRVGDSGDAGFQALLRRLGLGSHGDDHCLLLLDIRNAWPNPLSVSVQVRESLGKDQSPGDPWKRAYTVHEILQPGHTSRLVLLLPRIYISNPYAPIPSPDPSKQRQYVVSASKTSPETELASRSTFWYRSEILKHVRGSWVDESSGRKGDIELRGMRLSTRMVDAVKLEDISIATTISHITSSATPPIRQTGRSTFIVPIDTFLTLTTALKNRTSSPIHPLLRLQPSLRNQPHNIALDLTKKFAWNGTLQRALPVLGAGEEKEVRIEFCVLCAGDFEVGACVEEVRVLKALPTENLDGGGAAEDLGGLTVLRRSERRVWHAREACIITAVRGGVEE